MNTAGVTQSQVKPNTSEGASRNEAIKRRPRATDPVIAARNAKIVEGHRDGVPYKEMAKTLGITERVIIATIHKSKVAQNLRDQRKQDLAKRNGWIVASYHDGVPLSAIAQKIGVSTGVVNNVIYKMNGAANRWKSNDIRKAKIIARYQEGASYQEIAQELGVKDSSLGNIIFQAGVSNHKCRRAPDRIKGCTTRIGRRNATIIACYQEGATYQQISKRMGLTLGVVTRVIDNGTRNEQVIARYLEGASYQEIAQELGVKPSVIGMVIHNAGVAQDRPRRKNTALIERNAAIVQRYLDHNEETYEQIAQELRVTKNAVSTALMTAGVTQGRNKSDPTRSQLIRERYQAGSTYQQIGEEFGVSNSVIGTVIRNAHLVQGRHRKRSPDVAARNANFVAMYIAGKTQQSISRECRVSTTTVRVALRKAGVNRRCRIIDKPHPTGATP
jgi:DNA-directed RNA polymerase specialized sigma24 family protein